MARSRRTGDGEFRGQTFSGQPIRIAVKRPAPCWRDENETFDRARLTGGLVKGVGCGVSSGDDRVRPRNDLAQEPIEERREYLR
jgi:hypothetical protein